jgi:hypothetical protein
MIATISSLELGWLYLANFQLVLMVSDKAL